MITIFIYFELQYTKLIVELYTIAITNATQAAAKRTPPPPKKKKAGLNGTYLCDTGAVLYQLSYRASWVLVIM